MYSKGSYDDGWHSHRRVPTCATTRLRAAERTERAAFSPPVDPSVSRTLLLILLTT